MKINEWKAKGAFFNFESHEIFYVSKGEGPTLLLLHGFPTSSYDWYKVHEQLSASYRVICFDMLGYGFSDKPIENNYSIFQQANLVESLMAYLNLTSCYVLAHDKGDTVVNELIARQNEEELSFKIHSCCLLNGGLFPGIHKPRPVQWALMTPIGKYISRLYTFGMFKKTFNKIFGPKSRADEDELVKLWTLMNHKDGMKIFHLLIHYMQDRIDNEERWLTALQETTIPLRLIDGAFDPISGEHMAKHYEKVIKNPDVVLLPNIGHYPQLEAPELVLEHFHEFMHSVLSDKG